MKKEILKLLEDKLEKDIRIDDIIVNKDNTVEIILDSDQVLDLNRVVEVSRVINEIIDNSKVVEKINILDIYAKSKGE